MQFSACPTKLSGALDECLRWYLMQIYASCVGIAEMPTNAYDFESVIMMHDMHEQVKHKRDMTSLSVLLGGTKA